MRVRFSAPASVSPGNCLSGVVIGYVGGVAIDGCGNQVAGAPGLPIMKAKKAYSRYRRFAYFGDSSDPLGLGTLSLDDSSGSSGSSSPSTASSPTTNNCDPGFSPDANGNCVNSKGQGDGCSSSSIGVLSDGTCVGASGPEVVSGGSSGSSSSSSANTPWYSALASSVGTFTKTITGQSGGVKSPVTGSGSSLLVPLLFVGGAIGAVVYFSKRKKS